MKHAHFQFRLSYAVYATCGLGSVVEYAHLFSWPEYLKRQLNQGSFVLLRFVLFAFLYCA